MKYFVVLLVSLSLSFYCNASQKKQLSLTITTTSEQHASFLHTRIKLPSKIILENRFREERGIIFPLISTELVNKLSHKILLVRDILKIIDTEVTTYFNNSFIMQEPYELVHLKEQNIVLVRKTCFQDYPSIIKNLTELN